MTDAPRKYTRDEMHEILRRALERQPERADITHDEMIEAAREVGIDTSAVESAAHDLVSQRSVVDAETAELTRRRRGFVRSLGVYGIVNVALAALDLLTTGGRWWFAVAIIWGIFVALHALSVFVPRHEDPAERKRRLEALVARDARRLEHEARLAEKRARHEAKRARKEAIRRGADQFEEAVEQGVAALLGGIAKQVQRGVDSARGTPTSTPGAWSDPQARDDASSRAAGLDRVAPPPSRVRVDAQGSVGAPASRHDEAHDRDDHGADDDLRGRRRR
ncbi:MAG: 2TM domain-containing protein [Deltaproteobacteria bacterium]